MSRLFELANTPYPRLFQSLQQVGIQAVSLQNWTTLQSTAALLTKPTFATLKVREEIARLQQATSDCKKWEAAPYHALLHWARLIQPPYLKWQQQQIAQFNDPLWWHRCAAKLQTIPLEDQADAHLRLFDLQQRWACESDYAPYSTLDVLHVYQHVIPVFAEWLAYAQTELAQQCDRLSPEFAQPYHAYLTELSRFIHEEKAKLRGCLHGRLAISAHIGLGHADQVIPFMMNELSTLGLLPPPPQSINAVSRGYLTPHAFVTIRNIIEKDGEWNEKQAFYALPYHVDCQFDKSLALPHYYRINADGCSYFIPPARSEMMPTHPPFYLKLPTFLHQLFWGDVVVYTFFQHEDCQTLLAQNALRRANPPDVTMPSERVDLLHHPVWQQGQACLERIDAEWSRTLSWLDRAWLFLFPTAKALLQGYQADLQQGAQNWANQQLTLIHQQITRQPNALHDPKTQATVKTAVEYLANTHARWHFSAEWVTQLQAVQHAMAQACQASDVDAVPADTLVSSPTLPELPLREAFPLALKQVVHLVKHTQTVPASCLKALETQLNTDAPDYDSVQLRLTLTDYMTQTRELPHTLKTGLQAVLDEPRFSATQLDTAEQHRFREQRRTLLNTQTLPLPSAESPLSSLWDEDPWHDDAPASWEAHCQALTRYTQTSEGFSTKENEKLCQYTLRFLKHWYALPHWDDFMERRDHIVRWLETLIPISESHFAVLTPTLSALASCEKKLCAQNWPDFLQQKLLLRIEILETFLNPQATVNSNERTCAASSLSNEATATPPSAPVQSNLLT